MSEKSREEVVDEWVAQQHQLQRQKRKKERRLPSAEGGVTINSLMDAMFIILVFLLMNYAVDPLKVEMSKDLKLPASTTEIGPEGSAAVTITAKGIVVNDQVVVSVKNGVVPDTAKGGDDQTMNIQPLFEALNEEVTRQKQTANMIGGKFDGVLTVIAHGETPYRLLTEVLYTAGQAEFQKFKFAVIKGGARGAHPG